MTKYCGRCVLSPDVPGVVLDKAGVCNYCREYEMSAANYNTYFRAPEEFAKLLSRTRIRSSKYDCLLLYSGGKDSTYVLYHLVQSGYRVLAYTFDNGYISERCFENIEAVCSDLKVECVIGRLPKISMDRIFSLSLKATSTVCWGCFRSLTSLGNAVAQERGIPIVVTGLSRGQIFDTKVHPLLRGGVVDMADIEAHLEEFRECYTAIEDETAGIIRRNISTDGGERPIASVDYFRYHDVSRNRVVEFLNTEAPAWRRPENVGSCSTNCMINDLGIAVHRRERGYNDYVVPLSWDIRFEQLDRASALEDVTARIDKSRVDLLARELGGVPQAPF